MVMVMVMVMMLLLVMMMMLLLVMMKKLVATSLLEQRWKIRIWGDDHRPCPGQIETGGSKIQVLMMELQKKKEKREREKRKFPLLRGREQLQEVQLVRERLLRRRARFVASPVVLEKPGVCRRCVPYRHVHDLEHLD